MQFDRLKRREFILLLGGSAAAWPLAGRAQQTAMPVIGYLYGGAEGSLPIAAFKEGLRETGYIEGQNSTIDYRWANAHYDQLPALAADLVRRPVAVIAAASPVAARAAKLATTSIPIVFVLGSDPVRDGLVASLSRPGANVTGATFFGNLLSEKRLDLFHRLVPQADTLGLLLNPGNINVALERSQTQEAARPLGLRIVLLEATNEGEINKAISVMVQQRIPALIISGDGILFDHRQQITELANQYRIATSCPYRQAAVEGCLMSYGTHMPSSFREQGIYVGRILKGEKPADLPVLQATKFEFVINIGAAKTLGLDVSPGLLSIADEIVE
jgi:putative ABC transport system substrate-binding protein